MHGHKTCKEMRKSIILKFKSGSCLIVELAWKWTKAISVDTDIGSCDLWCGVGVSFFLDNEASTKRAM